MKTIWIMTLITSNLVAADPDSVAIIRPTKQACEHLRSEIGMKRRDAKRTKEGWSVAYCTEIQVPK